MNRITHDFNTSVGVNGVIPDPAILSKIKLNDHTGLTFKAKPAKAGFLATLTEKLHWSQSNSPKHAQ